MADTKKQPPEPEVVEAEPVDDIDTGIEEEPVALAQITRGEFDVQIATAKRYPRSVRRFKAKLLELATIDVETAGSMFYRLKRSGKLIEGPSARFSEVALQAWTNTRCEARVISIGDRFITAQGTSFDLETNTAVRIEVQRRITDRAGERFGDDMIGVTGNAAVSIALRNAVFKMIPKAYWKPVLDDTKLATIGKTMTMEQRRDSIFRWFEAEGKIKKEKLLAYIERAGMDDVTLDDLLTLAGTRNAIKDGTTTFDEVFAAPQPALPPQPKGAAGVAARMEAQAEPPAEPGAPTPTGTIAKGLCRHPGIADLVRTGVQKVDEPPPACEGCGEVLVETELRALLPKKKE